MTPFPFPFCVFLVLAYIYLKMLFYFQDVMKVPVVLIVNHGMGGAGTAGGSQLRWLVCSGRCQDQWRRVRSRETGWR